LAALVESLDLGCKCHGAIWLIEQSAPHQDLAVINGQLLLAAHKNRAENQ